MLATLTLRMDDIVQEVLYLQGGAAGHSSRIVHGTQPHLGHAHQSHPFGVGLNGRSLIHVRTAFAMTINKAQGLSMSYMGLCLPHGLTQAVAGTFSYSSHFVPGPY